MADIAYRVGYLTCCDWLMSYEPDSFENHNTQIIHRSCYVFDGINMLLRCRTRIVGNMPAEGFCT